MVQIFDGLPLKVKFLQFGLVGQHHVLVFLELAEYDLDRLQDLLLIGEGFLHVAFHFVCGTALLQLEKIEFFLSGVEGRGRSFYKLVNGVKQGDIFLGEGLGLILQILAFPKLKLEALVQLEGLGLVGHGGDGGLQLLMSGLVLRLADRQGALVPLSRWRVQRFHMLAQLIL